MQPLIWLHSFIHTGHKALTLLQENLSCEVDLFFCRYLKFLGG